MSADCLECPKCHATAELRCSCGVEYVYMTAGKRAAAAVAAHPEKSDRALAAETGVGVDTIGRARRASGVAFATPGPGAANATPGKRVGRDGKSYSPPKPRKNAPKPTEALAAALVLDKGKSLKEAAREAGVKGSEQNVRYAIAREQGRREAAEENSVDVSTLSKSAQEKIEIAVRKRAKELELSIEGRVRALYQEALAEVLPWLEKRERQAKDCINARRGIMPRKQFLAILSALHPDSRKGYTEERLSELFRAFKKFELVICKEAEFPTDGPSLLPKSAAEWMAMKQRATAARAAARAGSQGVQRPAA